MRRRVVVTGLGAITPLGLDVKATWDSLLAGRSGVGPITRFDADEEQVTTTIAAEVKGFDPELRIDRKDLRKMDLFIPFGIFAALEALEHSNLIIDDTNAERVAVVVGAGLGGLPYIEKYAAVLREKGPRKVTPFFIPMTIANLAAGHISIITGAKGPNSCVVTACATGTHSIGTAYRMIQYGDADAAIAGGTEATITPLAFAGFNSMKALSTRNDEPELASRPFDKGRDGFVMGEGAGVIILEELEFARARGAEILAEITGFGMSGDAYHITSPAEGGAGAIQCMKAALSDGRINPGEVSYINAHGTSTYYNDMYETMAIKGLFGEAAYKIPVSSTKSMTGHLLGAAGGVEAVAAIKTVMEDKLPPTINYEEPDPECDLDYVPNTARDTVVDVALSNTYGFGGTNGSLVFRKFVL
ncbi:MAG: beta-ketoacyl-ACP synthase II [bacterium]|nr:beta-ketoacyl-ACP synthase II [bacterium]MDT8366149.1 beta-ketoacyl-ACP synthase II [bacterium]